MYQKTWPGDKINGFNQSGTLRSYNEWVNLHTMLLAVPRDVMRLLKTDAEKRLRYAHTSPRSILAEYSVYMSQPSHYSCFWHQNKITSLNGQYRIWARNVCIIRWKYDSLWSSHTYLPMLLFYDFFATPVSFLMDGKQAFETTMLFVCLPHPTSESHYRF